MDNSIARVSGPASARTFFDPAQATSVPAAGERAHSLPIEELGLRHLKTLAEIEKILNLREAIDLSVHSRAHSDFLALEKKETSAALWGPSNYAGKS